MKHLIYYDDSCPFCQKCIEIILKIDRHKIFTFAPLGENLPGNTLVLLENYKTSKEKSWIRAKAVFRIFYLMGGKYKIVGVFCFLPSFLIDPFYRLIAKYRRL